MGSVGLTGGLEGRCPSGICGTDRRTRGKVVWWDLRD